MKLWSETFRDGGLMPAEYAFAEIDPASRVRLAGNRNPHLAWDEVPNGTESLALFCIDPDAPQDASLANRDDQALPLTAPRGDFYHWSLLDLPPAIGTRPSFTPAAAPQDGLRLFTHFVDQARSRHATVQTGQFGADMQVSLTNDGPVTFWLQVNAK